MKTTTIHSPTDKALGYKFRQIEAKAHITTIAEFEAFIARIENAGRHFERINGEIVEDTPLSSGGR